MALPTEEELAKLPPRLIVAYAAACAERVWPFSEIGTTIEDLIGVRSAIDLANLFARGQKVGLVNLRSACRAAFESGVISDPFSDPSAADAMMAANAAAYAAKSAIAAIEGLTSKASSFAYSAARRVTLLRSTEAALTYFNLLKDIATRSYHLSEELPLWPNGEPRWYTELVAENAKNREAEKSWLTVNETAAKYDVSVPRIYEAIIDDLVTSTTRYLRRKQGKYETILASDAASMWPLRESEFKSEIAGPLRVYIDSDAYSASDRGAILSLLSELSFLKTGTPLTIDDLGSAQPAKVPSPTGGKS